ncbi:DUF5107 domain-containing protein [Occultella glacieicola]|uniref:DUF5107 domain-containing protein n=1 Tax=Occultella glacieicola TaxID=2518684 RepID=A0ABY2E5S4_9MICO|nr:DUF5107 domain-containing protein [Occultella glacieicola]TDE95933.1 DUF5107 domain-containing protein [Occultella glacieicola]
MLTAEPLLELPDRPADQAGAAVAVWREPLTMRTYLPAPPSDLPAYLDSRVYQGSSGRVYPLPFHDRIASQPRAHDWDAVHLENEWIRLLVLPELGGRVHLAIDRTTGHDLFYGNPVIKPALVGLAGPWIAGGIELNWPQHHRPATFLPTDVEIEHEADGSITVWCSDHDPFERMKGMHGIRLRPGRSAIELRVRLYNRTPLTQTFLWWANVAARADADYQSFFPEDVHVVADHAKRAVTAFPAADRPYYDIDYPSRSDRTFTTADGEVVTGDRIDWWENIPVPTSYMVTHSAEDFFGGYDHAAGMGFAHVADRQLAVGKKQWTWGNSAFGRAWGRNLADDDSAYVELMAGVFTDNQPDFAFLAPGETKVFEQCWYPLPAIGPADRATAEAAVRIDVTPGGARVGVVTTGLRPGCRIELLDGDGRVVAETVTDIDPGTPALWQADLPDGVAAQGLGARVVQGGVVLVEYTRPRPETSAGPDVAADEFAAVAAREPEAPGEVASVEELLDIAGHLEQYRHATRSPEPYWAEALRRDPGNAAAHTAVGIRRLRQAALADAEDHLRAAVARLTEFHPTAPDATALYHLGLVLALSGRGQEAYDSFGRASWNRPWRAPAGYQMARLDAAAGRTPAALHRLADVLRTEPEHLQARTLRARLLGDRGRPTTGVPVHDPGDAEAGLAEVAAVTSLDPLHWWTRDVAGADLTCDAQTCLDVALEYAGIGALDEALRVLGVALDRDHDRVPGQPAAAPLLHLHRAGIHAARGDTDAERRDLDAADSSSRAWCFPGRLLDAVMLTRTLARHPGQPTALALLGHWLYAMGRTTDALEAWQASVAADPTDPVVHRNLGLALVNLRGDLDGARAAYDRARTLAPGHARLLFESDQLDRRRAVDPAHRLATLESARDLVTERDDLTVVLANLLITSGRADEAYDLLAGRGFQPWEGGEGEVLRAWERASTVLARRALAAGEATAAATLIAGALDSPAGLGEARHPLATTAGLHLLAGDAASAAADAPAARRAWALAAAQVGDFRTMSASRHSEATYHSILALRRLDRPAEAEQLTADLAGYVEEEAGTPARIDYFATSLPQLLLFTPDLDLRKHQRLEFLRAQLDLLAQNETSAVGRLQRLLRDVPDHPDAHDLLSTATEGARP